MSTVRDAAIAMTTAVALSWCAAGAATESSAAPVRPARGYEAHFLALDGATCRARAIQAGTAVGWCNTPEGSHAFVWTEQTGVVDIGTLGGSRAEATALDGERVVGFSAIAGDAELHAFSWTRDGGMEDLGLLGGSSSTASSVSGERIVGDSSTASGDFHAFLWTPAAGMTDLGTLADGTGSSASAIHGRLCTSSVEKAHGWAFSTTC